MDCRAEHLLKALKELQPGLLESLPEDQRERFAHLLDKAIGDAIRDNQYDAPGAGWCFLLGDADMINDESCLGPDMTTFLENVCRLQLGYNIPTS
jgi:hypothetical protein